MTVVDGDRLWETPQRRNSQSYEAQRKHSVRLLRMFTALFSFRSRYRILLCVYLPPCHGWVCETVRHCRSVRVDWLRLEALLPATNLLMIEQAVSDRSDTFWSNSPHNGRCPAKHSVVAAAAAHSKRQFIDRRHVLRTLLWVAVFRLVTITQRAAAAVHSRKTRRCLSRHPIGLRCRYESLGRWRHILQHVIMARDQHRRQVRDVDLQCVLFDNADRSKRRSFYACIWRVLQSTWATKNFMFNIIP